MKIEAFGLLGALLCPTAYALSCEPVLGLPADGLQASLTASKQTVQPGKPIELTLSLANVGDERRIVDVRDENWRLVIHDEDWNVIAAGPLSLERGFGSEVEMLEPGEHWERSIRPFESRRFREAAGIWELEGVPPGRYWFAASYYAPAVNDDFWCGGLTTANVDLEYLPDSAIVHCERLVDTREDLEACGEATRVSSRRLERYFPELSFSLVDVKSVAGASMKMLTVTSREDGGEALSCLPLDYETPSTEFLERLTIASSEDKESGLDLSRAIGQLLSDTVPGARTHSIRWSFDGTDPDVRVNLALANAPLRDIVLRYDAQWHVREIRVETPAVEALPSAPRPQN